MAGYGLLFSGGKESVYAMLKVSQLGIEVKHLIYIASRLTAGSPHHINLHVLEAEARLMNLPLLKLTCHNDASEALAEAVRKLGLVGIVAGDIMVEEHLEWLESVCRRCGVELLEPLWNRRSSLLLLEEVSSGIRPLIVGVKRGRVSECWLGATLDEALAVELIREAEREGWDCCGEYGEYHSLVVEAPPLFKKIEFKGLSKLRLGETLALRIDTC